MPAYGKVRLFTVLNLVWGGMALFGAAVWLLAAAYGVLLSGESGKELAEGVAGCIMLVLPCLAAATVFLAAATGMKRLKLYGYHFHIIGAVIVIPTGIGMVYTVVALVFAFRDDFRQAFQGQEQLSKPAGQA